MGESDSSSNKIGLALSGGGYRATLFGLGSLVRLNELGILKNISRISSVSGGSILNAYLAMRWPDLKFNSSGVADNFHDVIVKNILEYCSETTISKFGIGLNLINPFSSNPKTVRKQYDKLLFDGKLFSSIAKIPVAPQFLFYGTSFQTGASVRMVDSLLYDYNIGAIDISQWSIATVVGISSAFPPVLSPVILKLDRTNWIKSKYEMFFDDEKFKSELRLCDGGLYDNLGIECLWEKDLKKLQDTSHEYNAVLADDIDICLVSDAGAPLMQQAETKSSVASQLKKVIDIMGSQVGALRKRSLIEKFKSPELKGTYWGISTKIDKYNHSKSLTHDNDITKDLKSVETVLTPLPDKTKAHLVNWAYALTDSAIQSYCRDSLKIIERTPSWPLPEYPLNSNN